jgi:hypothetical protein
MKGLVILGIVLMVLGGLVLVYRGITYTDKEQVVDIGPIEASAEREKTVPVHPILGGILLATGVGLTVYGARRTSHA